MKHIKKFENIKSGAYLQRDESLHNLKVGDKVVYIEDSNKTLNYGQTYIITSILTENDVEVELLKDGDYMSVKDLNGNDINSITTNKPRWVYPKRFVSLLKYEMNKYNL